MNFKRSLKPGWEAPSRKWPKKHNFVRPRRTFPWGWEKGGVLTEVRPILHLILPACKNYGIMVNPKMVNFSVKINT